MCSGNTKKMTMVAPSRADIRLYDGLAKTTYTKAKSRASRANPIESYEEEDGYMTPSSLSPSPSMGNVRIADIEKEIGHRTLKTAKANRTVSARRPDRRDCLGSRHPGPFGYELDNLSVQSS